VYGYCEAVHARRALSERRDTEAYEHHFNINASYRFNVSMKPLSLTRMPQRRVILAALVTLSLSVSVFSEEMGPAPLSRRGEVTTLCSQLAAVFENTREFPREMLADHVEVWHLPALPGDPEVVARGDFGRADRAALLRAMPDFHMHVLSSATEKDSCALKVALKGTRHSGELYASFLQLRFIITNGLVTRMYATQDASERSKLNEIATDDDK
jgi:hypothetical protein